MPHSHSTHLHTRGPRDGRAGGRTHRDRGLAGVGEKTRNKRRRQSLLQKLVSEAVWSDERQDLAHDKERWRALQSTFVTMVTKVKRSRPVLAGRHKSRPTPESADTGRAAMTLHLAVSIPATPS